MKIMKCVLTVPFIYKKEMGRQLQCITDEMFEKGILVHIQEEEQLKKSTFTLTYKPANGDQLNIIRNFEKQIKLVAGELNK